MRGISFPQLLVCILVGVGIDWLTKYADKAAKVAGKGAA